MSWFKYSIRAAAALMVIGLTGCVTAPGYRYVVDVGGDYYYDERPALTTTVHVPAYGALGYGSGGWYGSVGFGFGTYYGLGGYYGPAWGAFGPRGYAGYWRPPYYYTPRYSRPPHYYRPPYSPLRPLPWRGHDPGYAWRQPGYARPSDPRRWNPPLRNAPPRNRPGDSRWRGNDNRWAEGGRSSRPGRPERSQPRVRVPSPPPARSAMPGGRETPRDMAIQLGPSATPRRVQDAVVPPSRQPNRPLDRAPRRAAVNGVSPRRSPGAATVQPQPRRAAPAGAPAPTMTSPSFRRAAAPAIPRPAAQARPVPMQRPSAAMPVRSAAPLTRAPPPAPRAAPRRSGVDERQR